MTVNIESRGELEPPGFSFCQSNVILCHLWKTKFQGEARHYIGSVPRCDLMLATADIGDWPLLAKFDYCRRAGTDDRYSHKSSVISVLAFVAIKL